MDSKNSRLDKYGAVVQLVIHAENISWNRFNNFLVAATVFVIAWATIYSTGPDTCTAKLIQGFICILGILGGIAWAYLGYTSRDYVDMYFQFAEEIESGKDDSEIKLFQRPKDVRINRSTSSLSRFLLIAVPVLFSVLYLVMLVATALKS